MAKPLFKPLFVTFTGADDHTDVGRLVSLSSRYPVEWGVLFGREAGVGRFPSQSKVAELLDADLRCSAHLCGRYAREVLRSGRSSLDLTRFARVQVKARERDYADSALAAFAAGCGRPVIRQIRGHFTSASDVQQLFDASGGRGRLPDRWPPQPADVDIVGYSGGLAPGVVSGVLAGLDVRNCWIDMESGVRSDDVFSPDLCAAVLREVYGEGRRRWRARARGFIWRFRRMTR